MSQSNIFNKGGENSPQPSCCMKSARSAPISLAVGMKRSTNHRQAAISLMGHCKCTVLYPRSLIWRLGQQYDPGGGADGGLLTRSFLMLWPAEMRTGCIFYQESRSGTWFPARCAHNVLSSSTRPHGKSVRALEALQKILAPA